jgi:acetolactate synthase-1/2/3 large subunit
MKVSDYIVSFLEKLGTTVIFGYQGSSISHIIDSISRNDKMNYIQAFHEQAAAFAANGYAEVGGEVGVAVSCSGPGAINLMNGIANAYYDSHRCMFITGQVSTPGIRLNKKIRQLGFQETDIVSMVEPITKYAVTIMKAEDIAYHLEKAVFFMTSGRPGPVVIDIPHNIQASIINENSLKHFELPVVEKVDERINITKSIEMLKNSKRPVLLLGGGAKGIKTDPCLISKLKKMKVPMVSSYRGKDILDNTSANYFGVIGAYGNRGANFLVKYCDIIIVVGSRLDGRQTGDNLISFANGAKVIYVDIDNVEISEKPGRFVKICCDSNKFLHEMLEELDEYEWNEKWISVAEKWKKRFDSCSEYIENKLVNPNKFVFDLVKCINGASILTTDVGQNQIWTNSSVLIEDGGYLIQSCGLGAMGYSLPAAIGAYFKYQNLPLLCICGDGGFQMNMQELQTIAIQKIPVKIFILNNKSLGLIRIYQNKALNSNCIGSVHGFSSPDYEKLAKAYDLPFYRLQNNEYHDMLNLIVDLDTACLVEVCISENSTCFPEPTYKSTVENQSPLLSDRQRVQIEEEVYNIEEN